VCLEPPLEQPFRLLLLLRDEPDDILAETFRDRFGLDVGVEAVLVLARGEFFDGFSGCGHVLFASSFLLPATRSDWLLLPAALTPSSQVVSARRVAGSGKRPASH